MKKSFVVLLVSILSGCATNKGIMPGEQWYIVEQPGSVIAYESIEPLAESVILGQHECYQIISKNEKFYQIKAESGPKYFLKKKSARPKRYSPVIHPSDQTLKRISYERAKCSDFSSRSDALAAFRASPEALSELDADGDGDPCEYCYKWAISKKTSTNSYSPPSPSNGSVHVKGHYRTTKNGKRVWVKPHTRRK